MIAAVFTVPDLWWQASHGWPTIAMTRRLNQENGGVGNIPSWVVGQLIMVSPALIWVWMAGLKFLSRSHRPLWRALVWAYGLLFVFFALTTGSKIYYLAGAYVYLLAAGAVSIEARMTVRSRGASAAFDLDGDLHRRGPAPGAARAAREVHRLDLQGQHGAGRDGWLARAGRLRCQGVALPAGGPALPGSHLHAPTMAKPGRSTSSDGPRACQPR